MTAHRETRPATGDAISEAGGWLASLGIVTMALFPFAVPALALAMAALLPLLVLSIPVALLALLVGGPILLVRRLRRRSAGRDEEVGPDRAADIAAGRAGLAAVPPVRVPRTP